MSTRIEPIFAMIRTAPTSLAPAGQHQYVADVQTPDGVIRDQVIGHSAGNFWPSPLLVRPLPVGRLIFGLRVMNHQQWHYVETPDFGPCSTGATLNRSLPVGSALSRLLAEATRDDLLLLKKLLESVQ